MPAPTHDDPATSSEHPPPPEGDDSTPAPSAGSAPSAGPKVTLPSAQQLDALQQIEHASFEPDAFQPGRAIAGAMGLGLVGAVLWAVITYVTEYELGLIAILLGILAGLGAARGGRTPQSQIVGAVAAGVCYFVAQLLVVYALVGDSAVLTDPSVLALVMSAIVKETFGSLGILFLGIAIYEGYRIPRPR